MRFYLSLRVLLEGPCGRAARSVPFGLLGHATPLAVHRPSAIGRETCTRLSERSLRAIGVAAGRWLRGPDWQRQETRREEARRAGDQGTDAQS